jgi:hypothetical protein
MYPTLSVDGAIEFLLGVDFAPTITLSTSGANDVISALNVGGTVTSTVAPSNSSFRFLAGLAVLTSATASAPPIDKAVVQDGVTIRASDNNVGTVGAAYTVNDVSTIEATTNSDAAITVTRVDTVRSAPRLRATVSGASATISTRSVVDVQDFTFTSTGTVHVVDNVGLDLANMVVGTSGNRTVDNVYGVRSALAAGTNRWFFYGSGTADSALAGGLALGSVATAPGTGNLYIAGTSSTGYIDVGEYNTTTDAAAPADSRARVYVRDNGAGKEQVVVRFNTGAVQVLATEP